MKKSALRTAILQELRDELARQTKAAALARDEAISEESQPENKWDTHSQEAAYLAEGQARQVIEVGKSIELYETISLPDFSASDPVALVAVVGVEGPAGPIWYFVGPRAGGVELNLRDRKVLVITPQSPLGRQLVGKRIGDAITPPGPAAQSPLRISVVE